jgi:L-aminopeptidase/D-esterase-like protein
VRRLDAVMAERGARGGGLPVGRLPTGPHDRLTDVLGVRVGHRTVREQDVRTGVTVVLPHRGNPFREKVAAGMHVANGYTKAAGLEQVRELGTLESPVAITNTLAVGRVLAGRSGAGWPMRLIGSLHGFSGSPSVELAALAMRDPSGRSWRSLALAFG